MALYVPLLVFTDLDGTLIDHHTYDWQEARTGLGLLREIGAGVVLASSKTAHEIIALRRELNLNDWPVIVENGAGYLPPGTSDMPPSDSYERLRALLDDLPPDQRACFRGFGDMTTAEVADVTGLPAQAATQAKTRAFSEPGLWSGPLALRNAFVRRLSEHGITAREGGRFLTLSFGATKADQMARIIAKIQPAHTLALGDAPNDVEMLEAADHGVIVANPARTLLPPLQGERLGRITRTQMPGPAGWNRAILECIAKLKLR